MAEPVGQGSIRQIGHRIGEDRQAERQLHDAGSDREARPIAGSAGRKICSENGASAVIAARSA